jgi:hypothetical protein
MSSNAESSVRVNRSTGVWLFAAADSSIGTAVDELKLNRGESRRSKLDSIVADAKQHTASRACTKRRLRPNQLNDH